ncbi:hypothetical protein GCM10011274_21340 [Paraglaciecola chathamensis]|jgi:hypothetical protein|uniref:Uncharacterized protein n=2 Tax=Paraglaciecola chathamensis TaxID=368405 RepID=A0A8H9ICM2_9ALTE|nr:hypothetical protein GAGA_2456 [Paraglaciecola agarilytica NO2]GGZ63041.1 hypothetical protein GCM10011274_21340 [Paraglaciecola oceanifecundans]
MLLDNRLEKFIYLMCGTKSKLKGRYSRPGEIICAKQEKNMLKVKTLVINRGAIKH